VWLEDINILRGWAIFLVVVGHLPFLNEVILYRIIRVLIYSFHMPLFMMISGYLFGRFSKERVISSFAGYKNFLIKKAKRFIPAYFLTMLLLGSTKFIIGKFTSLKHPFTFTSLFMMFINPLKGGFVTHLWFLYTLLIIFLIYPLLEKLLWRIPEQIKTIIYLGISFLPLSYFFCLDLVGKYLVYFYLGDLISQKKWISQWKSLRMKDVLLGIIVLILILNVWINSKIVFGIYVKRCLFFITSVLGSFGSYLWILELIRKKSFLAQFFNILGFYGFEIYLFHTLGSESFAYVVKFLVPFKTFRYILIFIFSTMFGILIPIGIKKVLKKIGIFKNPF
ncbi:MAG TPA: acyltransferase, partial [Candidatus Atribacteria bacterium]|nr:acyltransferase [Candidatus Atribacteria bacterium]